MKYRFRAHDTFFIRKGWINKGLKRVIDDPYVFMGVNGNPMDILGIGSNMVKALRYWLQALGLTYETTSGKREQHLTVFGETIFKYDPYTEEIGTLLLLHYKLATNIEDATAWYYFFNEFRYKEFTRDDFVFHIQAFLHLNEIEVAERSLEDDFNCIINTYIPHIKSNPQKVQPESNIDSPLGELGLVEIQNKKSKLYKKCTPKTEVIHPLILLSVIIDQASKQQFSEIDQDNIEVNVLGKEIRISTIQDDKCNAGRVYNLDVITLTRLLNMLENMELIKVIRTAGLDVIRIETSMTFKECIEKYYESLNIKVTEK